MTSSRIVLVAALSLLTFPVALPPVAADHGDPARARYVLADGLPAPFNTGFTCLDLHRAWTGGTLLLGPLGEHPIPQARGPEVWVGGACFRAGTGERAVDVVDDAGEAPEYWWILSGPRGSGCREEGQASGSIVVEVPEGCSTMAVVPLAGSAAGVIEVR